MWKQMTIVVALAILFTGVGWRAGAGSAAPVSADTVKAKIARDIYAQMLARWRNNERYDIEDLESHRRGRGRASRKFAQMHHRALSSIG